MEVTHASSVAQNVTEHLQSIFKLPETLSSAPPQKQPARQRSASPAGPAIRRSANGSAAPLSARNPSPGSAPSKPVSTSRPSSAQRQQPSSANGVTPRNPSPRPGSTLSRPQQQQQPSTKTDARQIQLQALQALNENLNKILATNVVDVSNNASHIPTGPIKPTRKPSPASPNDSENRSHLSNGAILAVTSPEEQDADREVQQVRASTLETANELQVIQEQIRETSKIQAKLQAAVQVEMEARQHLEEEVAQLNHMLSKQQKQRQDVTSEHSRLSADVTAARIAYDRITIQVERLQSQREGLQRKTAVRETQRKDESNALKRLSAGNASDLNVGNTADLHGPPAPPIVLGHVSLLDALCLQLPTPLKHIEVSPWVLCGLYPWTQRTRRHCSEDLRQLRVLIEGETALRLLAEADALVAKSNVAREQRRNKLLEGQVQALRKEQPERVMSIGQIDVGALKAALDAETRRYTDSKRENKCLKRLIEHLRKRNTELTDDNVVLRVALELVAGAAADGSMLAARRRVQATQTTSSEAARPTALALKPFMMKSVDSSTSPSARSPASPSTASPTSAAAAATVAMAASAAAIALNNTAAVSSSSSSSGGNLSARNPSPRTSRPALLPAPSSRPPSAGRLRPQSATSSSSKQRSVSPSLATSRMAKSSSNNAQQHVARSEDPVGHMLESVLTGWAMKNAVMAEEGPEERRRAENPLAQMLESGNGGPVGMEELMTTDDEKPSPRQATAAAGVGEAPSSGDVTTTTLNSTSTVAPQPPLRPSISDTTLARSIAESLGSAQLDDGRLDSSLMLSALRAALSSLLTSERSTTEQRRALATAVDMQERLYKELKEMWYEMEDMFGSLHEDREAALLERRSKMFEATRMYHAFLESNLEAKRLKIHELEEQLTQSGNSELALFRRRNSFSLSL